MAASIIVNVVIVAMVATVARVLLRAALQLQPPLQLVTLAPRLLLLAAQPALLVLQLVLQLPLQLPLQWAKLLLQHHQPLLPGKASSTTRWSTSLPKLELQTFVLAA